MVKLLSILFILLLSNTLFADTLSFKWKGLDSFQKVQVIEEFKRHLALMEEEFPAEVSRFHLQLFKEAYASDYNCFVGGWPSTKSSKGSCQHPTTQNEHYKNYLGCPSGKLLCNPSLFGDGLCIGFSTTAEKNLAFAQCEKAYAQEGRSFTDVLDEVDEREFQLLINSVNQNCQTAKTTLKASCDSLKHRLQFFVSDETPKNAADANAALKSGSVDKMMKASKGLQVELEKGLGDFEQTCKNPIPSEKNIYCKNVALRAKNAEKLLDRLHRELQSKSSQDCVNCGSGKVAAVLNPQSMPDLASAKQLTCSEAEKQTKRAKCGQEIMCSISSTLLSMPVTFLEAFGRPPGKCLASQNSCVTNFVSSMIDSLVSLVTGLWDILGSIAHWGGEKLSHFWKYVTSVEDKTSDAQHMLNKMSQDDVKAVKTNPIQWVTNLVKNIWSGIDLWLKEDVFCEKWSGVPRMSQCLQPMKNMECLSCRSQIAGVCSVTGIIAAEVIPAFLTGGTVNVVARGAKGAAEFAKVIKASRSYKKVASAADRLSAIKSIKVAGSATKTVATKSAGIVVSPLKAAYDVSAKSYRALKSSPRYQKLAVGMDKASTYSGIKALNAAQVKASQMGYEFVDSVLGVGAKASANRGTQVLGRITERTKLTVAVKKELKPLWIDLDDIYKKGGELREIEARARELGRIERPSKEILNELHDLEWKWKFKNDEMNALNDKFVNKIQEVYKKKGIPTTMTKADDGSLVLALDFTKAAPDQEAFEFYRRVSNKFGLNQVTLSVKENAAHGFGGFFRQSDARLEMGPQQAISLLESYVNSTGKHEGRHAMFFAKRNKGDDSIYHTQLYAQNEKLLNDAGIYDRFMSVEEIYTYSTDLQSLAQIFKGKYVTEPAFTNSILNQIAGGNEMLATLSKATAEVSESMSQSMVKMLKGTNPPDIHIKPLDNGNFDVFLADEHGRVVNATFVSEAEKKNLMALSELQKSKGKIMDQAFTEELSKKGVDAVEFEKRATTNALTLADKNLIGNFIENFDKTSYGVKYAQDSSELLKKVIVQSKVRMDDIQKVAKHQLFEASVLDDLLRKFAKTRNAEDLKLLKAQMFRMAKNVKEDSKTFVLSKN